MLHINQIISILTLLFVFAWIIIKKTDPRKVFIIAGIALFFIICLLNILFNPDQQFRDTVSEVYGNIGSIFTIDFLITSLVIYLSFGFGGILKIEGYANEILKYVTNALENNKSKTIFVPVIIAIISMWLGSYMLLSANAACGIVAPLVFPILLKMGISEQLAASSLILGTWGSIVNPADVNATTINSYVTSSINLPLAHLLPSIFALFAIAYVIYLINKKYRVKTNTVINYKENKKKRFNYKILIPILPFILLFSYSLFSLTVPQYSVDINKSGVNLMKDSAVKKTELSTHNKETAGSTEKSDIKKDANAAYEEKISVNKIAVAICLILCIIIAVVFANRQLKGKLISALNKRGCTGVLDVIGLIIASKIFIAVLLTGIGENNLEKCLHTIGNWETPIMIIIIFLFTILTGSGDAIVTSVITIVCRCSGNPALNPTTASMAWFAGEIGRCSSPVSAATKTIEKISNVRATKIALKSLLPSIFGLLVAILTLLLLNFIKLKL